MIRDVHLYGEAGRRFGRQFRLDIHSPAEAVRALCTLRPGFREAIRAGYWRVIVGPPRYDNAIPVGQLHMSLGAQAVHIVPATQPRGGDAGVFTIIAGVAIVAAAVVLSPFTAGTSLAVGLAAMSSIGLTYGGIAMIGVGLIATGIAGLLTPTPQVQPGQQSTDMAAPGDRPSFFFQGVTNNSQQGGPVPLVFGTHLTGSIVVSASITNVSL
jgi:predicted phage tail protein